jgi:hypothetical protein
MMNQRDSFQRIHQHALAIIRNGLLCRSEMHIDKLIRRVSLLASLSTLLVVVFLGVCNIGARPHSAPRTTVHATNVSGKAILRILVGDIPGREQIESGPFSPNFEFAVPTHSILTRNTSRLRVIFTDGTSVTGVLGGIVFDPRHGSPEPVITRCSVEIRADTAYVTKHIDVTPSRRTQIVQWLWNAVGLLPW